MSSKIAIPRVKTWEELTICDNFIFQKVMQKKRLCKRLIERILGIKVRRLMYPTTEKSINVRRDSKSVRLDLYVEDDRGTLYDIEMQTTDSASPEELPKRTRYYQAMMDMDILNKGELYTALRRTYIIFICTFDPFCAGRSLYTFRETCQEDTSLQMGDETTKIFLNSKGSREGIHEDLAAFLDYIEGKKPQGRFTEELDQEVKTAKENKEMKVEYMTMDMELKRWKAAGREEGRTEGRREGRDEGRLSMLCDLVRKGLLSLTAAAQEAGMTEENFKKMAML